MDITELLGWTFLIAVLAACLAGIVLLGPRNRPKLPPDVLGERPEIGGTGQYGGSFEVSNHAGGHSDGGGHSGAHADGGGHAGH